MCDNDNHQCPKEATWYPVKLQLLNGMKSISLQDNNEYIIPNHLIENNVKVRQYKIEILFFENLEEPEIDDSIDKSKFSIESVDFKKDGAICYAAPLFKRSGYSGYWVIKTPCISCYVKIAKECNDDIQVLTKASMLCQLNSMNMQVISL